MKSFLYRLISFPIELLRAVFSAPGRLLSSGRSVWGISLPARAAILVAIFLLLCGIVSFIVFPYLGWTPHFKTRMHYHVGSLLVLVVVIPIAVYYALKVWLEGEVSPFEDVDKAWKAGMEELERHGLDISQIPVFLVLGSSAEVQEKAVFDASRLSLNLRGLPQGPSALHWYANPDGIYIVCANTSGLSRLAAVARSVAEEDKSRPAPALAQPAGPSIRGTIVASSPDDSFQDPMARPGPAAGQAPPPSPRSVDYRGTMVGPGKSTDGPESAAAQDAGGPQGWRPVALRPEEAAEQDQRLAYLCTLVRRTRQPICPINGILTLIPFGLMQRGAKEGIEIQRTLKRDIATVLRVGKVRCPVTAVVVGMEEESGFRELVRRVGHERAAVQRFGRGFSVSNPPLPERLEALCAHACGAFEDWVYALFREKDALSKPGNVKLYSLLCSIRRFVQTRLGNILVNVYGSDPEQDPQGEPLFFSGCYFAAAGETEDRQAFVKGVFDKLPEEQAELQWTGAALVEDAKYQRLAQVVMGFDLLVLAALAAIIFFFRR